MNTTLLTDNQILLDRIEHILPECQIIDTNHIVWDDVILTDPRNAEEILSKNHFGLVIVLSNIPTFNEGIHLLSLGVHGYLNTYTHKDNLLQAIHSVASGNIWVYPEFIQEMIQQTSIRLKNHSDILNKLTDREEQTALLVVEGLSNKEIASRLDITERTVKNHLSHIFEKLAISDRLSLAMLMK